jgi:N-methylhydantoinase A
MSNRLEVGIDIGGTFTDVVYRDDSGQIQHFKVPTTREDESVAVLHSITNLLEKLSLPPSAIRRLVHGTTVGTNAVLERKGARVGIITTKGFRDVLELGRQMRKHMYEIILSPSTPTFLARRSFRQEVPERINFQGEIIAPLDESALLRAARDLREAGAESIAVSFLFSFVNPIHEQRAKALLKEVYPDLTLAVSHEVDPTFREYERTVVTAFDAYVKPTIDRYLSRIEGGLAASGVDVPLQVMQSRGGLMASSVARKRPVRLFLSGPAAGVIGARICGENAGLGDLITVDIGGTSSDIALIRSGEALTRSEGVIDGFPVRIPMIDVNTIGSGGGSIAWLNAVGALMVGPCSAGSEPGPACFGRDGVAPTVTDASVVLGYIDPDYFAGGSVKLYKERACLAVASIAKELSLDVTEAALGIHRIANAQMAEGIRAVTTSRGVDTRAFSLMPIGGGGGIHATALAEELSVTRIVVPRFPGVLAAAGLLVAPIEHEMSKAFCKRLDGLDPSVVRDELASLDVDCKILMDQEPLNGAEVQISYAADICYVGQGYWLEVPISLAEPDMLSLLYKDFIRKHREVYGHSDDSPAAIVNLRTVHHTSSGVAIESNAYQAEQGDPLVGVRDVLMDHERGVVKASVYRRAFLSAGFEFHGPAVVEQADTTLLIGERWAARVHPGGSLILEADAP